MSEPKENTKSHISFSQINTYLTCSLRHFFRYHEGLIMLPRARMTLGKSYDFAHSHNFKQKIESYQDLNEAEVLDAFVTNFDVQKKETIWMPEEKPDKFRVEGIKLVSKYHKEMSPKIQPVAVQDKITVNFSNMDVEFWAVPDLITNNRIIIDNKVTAKSMNQKDADCDLQPTAYALAYRTAFNKIERGFIFHNMVRLKSGGKFNPLATTRTDADVNRLLKLIGHVIHGIRKKIYHPCNPKAWWCDPDQCGYWEVCKERF